eukprot:982965_1
MSGRKRNTRRTAYKRHGPSCTERLQGRHQKSSSMSQLYIRSESFEGSKVISFNRNQTIKHIKLQIRDKTGIPVDKQRVFLQWKILKDDCLIADYNIQNGDTLLVKVDS